MNENKFEDTKIFNEDLDNNVEENEAQYILVEENDKENFDSEKISFDEFYPKKIIKKK